MKQASAAGSSDLEIWVKAISLKFEAARKARRGGLFTKRSSAPPSEDTIRLFLAAGLRAWADAAKRSNLLESVASPNLASIATLTLWPIVVAPVLPDDWFDRLQELTSPPIADIVRRERARGQSHAPQLQQFGRDLAAAPLRAAMSNLINDLTDPARGSSAFSELALIAGLPEVPKRMTKQQVFKWLAGAAGMGIFQGGAYDLEKSAFAAITDSLDLTNADHAHPSGTNVDHGGGQQAHAGDKGHDGRSSSDHAGFLEDVLKSILRHD